MRKIKKYNGDSFTFHQSVVKSKHHRPKDPTYKDRVNILGPDIQDQFSNHDEAFKKDSLTSLSPKRLTIDQKRDLMALYDYGAKPFQKLNDILRTGENGTRQPICPFCTINNSNTLDHLIPKSEFSELSDHPINLMPCCSECNSKKSSNWRIGNTRKYLNLYLDDLPDVQYLFPNLTITGATITVSFTIDNKHNIDNALFAKIQNHYNDLNLCSRFSQNSDITISELKNTLESNQRYMSKEQLKESIIESENKNRLLYGFNYWKSILKIECCQNNLVFDFLLK